jgi:SAM-dependent methyltransferase
MTRLTDSSFWNSEWKKVKLGNNILNESSYYFGKRGVFTKIISSKADLGKVSTVLEIGGGGQNFRLLALVKWFGFKVTALDYSPVALDLVKSLFDVNNQNANFVECDFMEFTTEDKFDLVVHWGVLEHFTDPLALIEKSSQLLLPGGQLVFTMPNMESLGSLAWKKWAPNNWSKHFYHSNNSIFEAMAKCGLSPNIHWHFGMPLVSSAWETINIQTRILNVLQKIVSILFRVFPFLGLYGCKYLSSERGFHAYKI